MRTERTQLFYDEQGNHFTSRAAAAKSNLYLRFMKDKGDRKGWVETHAPLSEAKSANTQMLKMVEEVGLIHWLTTQPELIESLLHGYYADMGEEYAIPR